MRKMVAWVPLTAILFCAVAFLSAGARADAHLTVCNSSPNDLAIAEAYRSAKGHWDTNSAVFVGKTKCVTFGDNPAPTATQFYLRVLSLRQDGPHTFDTAEVTYNAPVKSFCLATGQFSRNVAAYNIKEADSESSCNEDKAHIHDSGMSIQWVRFFLHALPRPTTHLNLE